jgi:P-type conjugative transfer protein TrbJ
MKKAMAFTVVLSMLILGVPAPTDAGAVAGLATEWTQILNHVQLVMGYIRQGLQLENELKQYEEELKQGLVLPQQVFGPIQQDLSQLAQVVQGGQALAYSMGNLDAQFRNTFKGYSFRTQGYFNDYKKWSQTSLDTTMNSLRAAGLQGQQLKNAQAVLAQLRAMSTGAAGQMQAVEVGNQIAEQQVEELMSLRQLMLTDLESKQAYQAERIQKEQADSAALEQVFGTQPLVTDQKKY